ncbi:MAG: hypothetical protein AMS16_05235 [Planctomycetes bacterium DG_58]|nr:MAG: hypothetical protein AMS16_05235 [Planctomycetes bacterium DG_58]
MPVELMSQWYVWILFGLLAGFASSLLGIGGGVVLMPLLVMVAGFDQNHARGTALGYMVGTCLVGALAYHMTEKVDLSLWVILLITAGGIVGAVGGWAVGHRISLIWLKRIFALLMVYAAVQMFWSTLGRAGASEGSGPPMQKAVSEEVR